MTRKKTIDLLRSLGITVDWDAKKVLDMLEEHDSIGENELAEKLEWRINDTRKILYKLATTGFVVYFKQKDEEKKWWYVYFWKLDRPKLEKAYIAKLKRELDQKSQELIDEQQYVFQCKKCKKKLRYEDALLSNFSCPSCSGVLSEIKSQANINALQKEIHELDLTIREEQEILKELTKQREEEERKLAEAAAEEIITDKKKPVKKKTPAKKKIASKKVEKPKPKVKPKKAPAKKKDVKKKPVKKVSKKKK